MKISDGPVGRSFNRTVFSGLSGEVTKEVTRYFQDYPANAYSTRIISQIEDPDLGRTTVEIERRLSCD